MHRVGKLISNKNFKEAGISKSWEKLCRNLDKECPTTTGRNWVFRGQPVADQGLKTSLERFTGTIPTSKIKELKSSFKDFKVSRKGKDYIKWLELGLLRKFQRQYHHYMEKTIIPVEGHIGDWFSLMQHYGAPTRLLDWTYSFGVATFFAIEDRLLPKKPRKENFNEIWAMDLKWLDRKLHERVPFMRCKTLKEDRNLVKIENFKAYNGKSIVVPTTPFYLNERLTIQQGFFLMPGDVTNTFESNLIAHSDNDAELKQNLVRFKIQDNMETKSDILGALRKMNMDRATLFPGLDGFAKSLGSLLFSMPEILVPGKLYYDLYDPKNGYEE